LAVETAEAPLGDFDGALSIWAMLIRLQRDAARRAATMEVSNVKYMCLLYATEGGAAGEAPGSAEFQRVAKEYGEAIGGLAAAGVLVDCSPLQPPTSATTVRVRNGEVLLSDGPAAEIKEQLGGYTVIDCADLDEAIKWAATIPAARAGSVEVRALLPVEAGT
jgi:hypothetical protein